MTKSVRYRCLRCGRHKFTQPIPHKCGEYRIRGLKWEKVRND